MLSHVESCWVYFTEIYTDSTPFEVSWVMLSHVESCWVMLSLLHRDLHWQHSLWGLKRGGDTILWLPIFRWSLCWTTTTRCLMTAWASTRCTRWTVSMTATWLCQVTTFYSDLTYYMSHFKTSYDDKWHMTHDDTFTCHMMADDTCHMLYDGRWHMSNEKCHKKIMTNVTCQVYPPLMEIIMWPTLLGWLSTSRKDNIQELKTLLSKTSYIMTLQPRAATCNAWCVCRVLIM